MAIDRKHQKIFGDNLTALGNIAAYGSKKAGSPTFSDNLDIIQTASWLQGIMGATSSDKAPYVQDLNAIFYVITKQLAYLFQAGIAEWDSQTDYFAGKSVVLKNGKIYIATSDNKNVEPEVTSGWNTKWKLLSYGSQEYFAECDSLAVNQTKEITIDNVNLDSNNKIPVGTKIKVSFTNGSNCALQSQDETSVAQLKINITNSSNTPQYYDISIGTMNTITYSHKKLFCPSKYIVTFVIDSDYKAYAENIIVADTIHGHTPNSTYYWSRQYLDGFIEQGGSVGGPEVGPGDTHIKFLFGMEDTSYYIGISAGISTESGGTVNRIYALTKYGFILWVGTTRTINRWEIKGYRA